MLHLKASLFLIVVLLALSGCQPDLTVSLTANPAYGEGEDVSGSVTATVANAGSAQAPGTDSSENGYMVDLVLSQDNSAPVAFAVVPDPYAFQEDMLIEGSRISNTETLAAGASKAYPGHGGTIPSGSPGAAHLCAVVDPGNKIAESDENNNVTCVPVQISKPDLVVTLTTNPSYRRGEDISSSVQAEVTNQGGGVARGTADAAGNGYMVDLVLSGDATVPVALAVVPTPYSFAEDMLVQGGRISNTVSLAAGASHAYSGHGGPIPPGSPRTAYLCAVADPGNKVEESNEANNTSCAEIRIRR